MLLAIMVRDLSMSGTRKYETRIVRKAKVSGDEPIFKGTRVTLRTVLASLAEGDTPAQVLAAFPSLQPEDVQAAIVLPRLLQKKTFPSPPLVNSFRDFVIS